MFRRTIAVGSPREVQPQLAKFVAELRSSNLPTLTATYLEEQVDSTLAQFQRHYKSSGVTEYNANRVFDGDGFKVIVKIRGRRSGLLAKVKKAIGYG